ncbi:extended synaptotagmin-2 isoform X3 [Zootermopsis nevadensis]|uniref:extended synaptotagmin-2 isoform X3 n=1 Tax=Zootermopsis nevadensis TaxID=136037 RepID=UPI000B8E90AD|nr:extended synaptotagmin-2 isoform X3 [Zootermopsis nevadensis]
MAGASKEKTESIIRKRIGGTSILSVLYSFAKKIGTVAMVYLIGYFEWSAAWLIGPVILSVIRDEWKKDKELRRNIAKAAAMCNEKEVILARVDDLPSWVFFPDVERVEWLNRILRQVWPNVNHYAKTLIKETIEPNVRVSLEAYKLYGFRFERVILGSIPLRIGGVKVYDRNVSRNEIILDMDVFYAGDCDISFTIGGIKGGIKDFQIHGMMRVVMKPLITSMPLVGGLQVFFLNNPTIDFNLVGMADLLDMPGLSDILRRIIVEQVANMMVLPNKLPIRLSDEVPATVLKVPQPEGVLRVHVVEAKQLMKMDIGVLRKGKSDPYAIISVGAQQFRTKTIDNTVNPKWDFWCEFEVEELKGQKLAAILYDKDTTGEDDFLGRATVDVSGVAKKGQVDLWMTLEGVKSGMVHLRMTWLTLSSSFEDLKAAIAETQLLRLTNMSTALLMVFIDSAKNLPNARPLKKPDPYAQLTVGKQQETTTVLFRTEDPVWEQGFTFLVNNPDSDTLRIKVIDQKTTREIGYFVYDLISLVDKPDLQVVSQPYRLITSGPDSKINLSLQMRILKFEGSKEGVTEDDDEVEEGDSLLKTQEESPLVQGDSVKKPDSPLSTREKEAPSEPGSPVRISKQESKDSLQSAPSISYQQPAEDLMTLSKAPPGVDSPPTGDLRNRTPSSTSSTGEAGLGRIQLTLRYSVQRQRLVVVVHKVANLPLRDPTNIPDPYVKLYLLPERAKDSKRKTETMKDNCNPVYDETFEYILSQGELNSRQLEVSVVTRKGWFSSQSPVMGQVVVNLGEQDLSKAITSWFDLQPESPKDV